MSLDLTELYQTYHRALVRVLYRRTGDAERAEELAQETFARAVAAPPDNPRAWLFAVGLNLVREDGRRNVMRRRRLELYRAEQPTATEPPDVEVERAERVGHVREALDTLNDREREALLLKAEGFSYDEIAETTGLARGAIGTTLSRARKKLVEAYHAQEAHRATS